MDFFGVGLWTNYRVGALGGSLSSRLYANPPDFLVGTGKHLDGPTGPSFQNACRGSPTEVTGYPPWIYLQWLCVIRYALWGITGTLLL